MSRFGLRSNSEGFKLVEEQTIRSSYGKKGINNISSITSHISHCPRITAAIDTGLTLNSANVNQESGMIIATKLRTSNKKVKKKKSFFEHHLDLAATADNEIHQQLQNKELCSKEMYNVEQHKACKLSTTINNTTSVTQGNSITRTVSIVCSLPLERLPRIMEKLSVLKQNQKQQYNSSINRPQKQQKEQKHEELGLVNDHRDVVADIAHTSQEHQKIEKTAETVNILCLFCDKKFTTNKLQTKHVEKTHMKHKEPRRRYSERNVQQKPDGTAQCNQFIGCTYCSSESAEDGKIKLKHHIVTPTSFSSSSITTSFPIATQICVPAKDLSPLFIHLTDCHADKYFGCKSCILRFQNNAKLVKHMQHIHNLEELQHYKINFPLMTTRKRERELKRNKEIFNEHDNGVLLNLDEDNGIKADDEVLHKEKKIAGTANLKNLKHKEILKKKSPIDGIKKKSSLDNKLKNIVISGTDCRNTKLRQQKLSIKSTSSERINECISKKQKKAKAGDKAIVFSSSSRLLLSNDDDKEQMLLRLGMAQNRLLSNRNRGTRLRREASTNCMISVNELSQPKISMPTSVATQESEVQQQTLLYGLKNSNTAGHIMSSNNNRNSRKINQIQESQYFKDIVTETSTQFRVPSFTDSINNGTTSTTKSLSLLSSSSATSSLPTTQLPSALSLSCVFDANFYKGIVSNVRNNLLHYLDGKVYTTTTDESIFSTEATSVLTTSLLQTKFKYQPIQYRHYQRAMPSQVAVDKGSSIAHFIDTELHEATNMSSDTAFPTLLTAEQYGPAIGDTIVYSPLVKKRRPHTKHSQKWTLDYVKKFKPFNECGKTIKNNQKAQLGFRNLAKLDMWTQLTMREKYELNRHLLYQLSPQSPPAFEQCQTKSESKSSDPLAVERARLEKHRLVEQLNYILDLRLLPHIILEQNEQAVIKFESDEFSEFAAQKRDEYDSDMSDLMTQTFADNSFLSMLQLQPRFNNSGGDQLMSSEHHNNLVLSGEWARPRCYLCICCGAKFEKLKSLEEHKMFRHSHIYATHYEVVGRELLAGNFLKHLFIPKCALSRYDAINNRSSAACRWQQLHHPHFRQYHPHCQYHYHRHHAKYERSTVVEDESSDSIQSVGTLHTTFENIGCGDDFSMNDKHLETVLLSSSTSRPSSASSSTLLNTTAIPMDDCYTPATTEAKATLDLNISPTHSNSSFNVSQCSSTSSSYTTRSGVKKVAIKNQPQTMRCINSNSDSSSATATSFIVATNSRRNSIKDHEVASAALQNSISEPATASCTKCGRKSNGVLDLYRHMLDCAGDYIWSMAKKRKYRYYCGSKKRRPCNKHIAMIRNIKLSSKSKVNRPLCDAQMTPHDTEESGSNYSKTKTPPRQRPSDAESIRKMLENLPAKRVCKKIFPTDNKKNKKSMGLKNKLVSVSRTRSRLYSQHVLRKTHQRKISPTRRLNCVTSATLRQQQLIEQQRVERQHLEKDNQMTKAGRIEVNKKITSICQANARGASFSVKAARNFLDAQEEKSSVAGTTIPINKSSNSDIITRSNSATKDLKDLEITTSSSGTILNRKVSKSTQPVDGSTITIGKIRIQRRTPSITKLMNNIDNIPSCNLNLSGIGNASISSCSTNRMIETTSSKKSLLSTPPTTPAITAKVISHGLINTNSQSSNLASTISTTPYTNGSSNVKRSKRINDCIAMLTGKLEEKLKTEQPTVTKGYINSNTYSTVNQNLRQNNEGKEKNDNDGNQHCSTNKNKDTKFTNMVGSYKTANSLYGGESEYRKEDCQTPQPSSTLYSPPSATIVSPHKMPKRKSVSRRIIKTDEILLLEENPITIFDETFSGQPPILKYIPTETFTTVQGYPNQVKDQRTLTEIKSAAKQIIIGSPPSSPVAIKMTAGKPCNKDQELQEHLSTAIPKSTGSINRTFRTNNHVYVAGEPICSLKNLNVAKLTTVNKKVSLQVKANGSGQTNVLPNLLSYLPMNNTIHAAAVAQSSMNSMAAHSISTQHNVYKEVDRGTVAKVIAKCTKNSETTLVGVASNSQSLPVQLQQLAMVPATTLPTETISQSQREVLNSQFVSTNLVGAQNSLSLPSAVPLALPPPLQTNSLSKPHYDATHTVPSEIGVQNSKQCLPLAPPTFIPGNGMMSLDIHHLSQFSMEPLNLTNSKSNNKKMGLGQRKEISESDRARRFPAGRQTICGFESRNLNMHDEMEPLDLSKKSVCSKPYNPLPTDTREGCAALTSIVVKVGAIGGTSMRNILNEGHQTNKNLSNVINQLPPPQDLPLPLVLTESTLNNLHTELSPLSTQVNPKASVGASTSIALQQQLKDVMPLGVVFTPGSLAEQPISTSEFLLNKNFYSNLDLLKIPQVRNPVPAKFVPIRPHPSSIALTPQCSKKINNHEQSISSPAILPLTQPPVTSAMISITPTVSSTKATLKNRSGGFSLGNIRNWENNFTNCDSASTISLTSVFRKDSSSTKNQIKPCSKLMDEVINNHIDDAINSVIMAVQASLPDDDDNNNDNDGVAIKTKETVHIKQEQKATKSLTVTTQATSVVGQIQQAEYKPSKLNHSLRQHALATTSMSTVEVLPVSLSTISPKPSIDTNLPEPAVHEKMILQKPVKSLAPPIQLLENPQTEQPRLYLTPKKRDRAKTADCHSDLLIDKIEPVCALEQNTITQQTSTSPIPPITQQQQQQITDIEVPSLLAGEENVSPVTIMTILPAEVSYEKVRTPDCKNIEQFKNGTTIIEQSQILIGDKKSMEMTDIIRYDPLNTGAIEVKTLKEGTAIANLSKDSSILDSDSKLKPIITPTEAYLPHMKIKATVATTSVRQDCKEHNAGIDFNSCNLVPEEQKDIMNINSVSVEQQQKAQNGKETFNDDNPIRTAKTEARNTEFIKSCGDQTIDTTTSDVTIVKKKRRRRKNELAAIVADQLLESFKIDNARRDNLKKLENLAYEKSDDLLLTGILLMSSTKRNATEKQQQTTELPYKRTKNDNTDTNTTFRKQTDKLMINAVEGNDRSNNIPSLLKLKPTRGRPKRRQATYQKRDGGISRPKSAPMASENISKLKYTLESFSIGIEKQLSEIEAKNKRLSIASKSNNNIKISPSTGRGRVRKNNAKAETASTTSFPATSSILRPSILNSAVQEIQTKHLDSKNQRDSSLSLQGVIKANVKHKSTPKNESNGLITGPLDDQIKSTTPDVATVSIEPQSTVDSSSNLYAPANNVSVAIYSRDPRLNKNIHKEENNHHMTQIQQGEPKLQDRRLRLSEICDLEEDNYLTEIAKNVNEKIMSGANEDFGFTNDEFELNNNPDNVNDDDAEDEHDKYYRPPTSMSVRSAPNLNDDHSNFDSMCDENTNTEVMDMDLDDEISVYTSYSQDVGRRCRRRRRRRSILLTRRPKKRSISTRDLTGETFDCLLCKKTFFTGPSLAKHNMTLAHVSKLSEQEYLMSKKNEADVVTIGEEESPTEMEKKLMDPFINHILRKQRPVSEIPPPASLTDVTEEKNVPAPFGYCLSAASSTKVSATLANSEHDVEKYNFSPESPETVVFKPRSTNTLLITEETLRMHDHHQENLQLCQRRCHNQQNHRLQYNHQAQQQPQNNFSSESHSNDLMPTSSRLDLNPDEQLFFECANILKGAETSHINQSTCCSDPRLNKVHSFAYTNAPPSVMRPPNILEKKSSLSTQSPLTPPPVPGILTSLPMNMELESPQSPLPESTATKKLLPSRYHHLQNQLQIPQSPRSTSPSPRSSSPSPHELQQSGHHRHQLSIIRNPQTPHHLTGHLLTYNNKLPLPTGVAAESFPLPISHQNTHTELTTNLTSMRLSPTISQFSATNITTSRFKTKAAMKGYENVDLTIQRELESKSRAVCKLTELADIALGSEKPICKEFLSTQPTQLSLSTVTSESDSNSKYECQQKDYQHMQDKVHYITQQQRYYQPQNRLKSVSDDAGSVNLLHHNNHNATNENPASNSFKTLMNSVAVIETQEQEKLGGNIFLESHVIADKNKIVIPDRPFKNIGLEEKETIQFQKPKITTLNLLTTEDEINSVSTASYSDRDDYDFGTMSCDENDDNENDNSLKLEANEKYKVKQNTDSSSIVPTSSESSATSRSSSPSDCSSDGGGICSSGNTTSSRATTKIVENKSLIMGKIFKNANTKVKANEVGTIGVVVSALPIVSHKVKDFALTTDGSLQKEQLTTLATTALPPPAIKANLDQLFDELRGASGQVNKSNETKVSSGLIKTPMSTTDNEIRQHITITQPALASPPQDVLPAALRTKGNRVVLTQQHPKITASCSGFQTLRARKVSATISQSKQKPSKTKKIATLTTANKKKILQSENLTVKGTTEKCIRTPRVQGRKEITKLQTELGMSQEEIEKLIDEGQRKSKRRCATNRTKKLVETWSSDEYEEFLSTKDIIALIEEKEKQEKRRKSRKTNCNVNSQKPTSETGGVSLNVQFDGKHERLRESYNSKLASKDRKSKQTAQNKKLNVVKARNDRAKSYGLEAGMRNIADIGVDKNYKKEPKRRVSTYCEGKAKQKRYNNMIVKATKTAANIASTVILSSPLTKTPRITPKAACKVGGGRNKKINVKSSKSVFDGTESLTTATQPMRTATNVNKQFGASISASSSTVQFNNRYKMHDIKSSTINNSASSKVKLHSKKKEHHDVVSSSKLARRESEANKYNVNTNTAVNSITASCGNTEPSINNNNSSKNNKNLKNKRKSHTNHKYQSQASRRKRPAVEKQLYYWSSSSSPSSSADNGNCQHNNEYGGFNVSHPHSAAIDEVSSEQREKCNKQDQEQFDETTEQYQKHGWIVGDSHKKLVKLLAIAKGGNNKVDNRNSVKRQTLKRKCL